MRNKYKVYVHVNKANNKKYVGITSQTTSQRWRGGGSGYKNNKYFWNAIQKYGWDNFEHYVLFCGLDLQTASDIEQKLISEYKSNERLFGYNNSVGGEKPALGHTMKHTEETKRKMSLSQKGRRHSKASREKMSKAQQGRKAWDKGCFGKDSPHVKLIYKTDLQGNILAKYYGANEVIRELGHGSASNIGECCRGERKTAYGYKWKYAEGE